MRKIFFISFLFLFSQMVLAQTIPYFSLRKFPSGFMIGFEGVSQKNNQVLLPQNYRFEWVIPEISTFPETTRVNYLFNVFDSYISSLFLKLKITDVFRKKEEIFEAKMELPPAQVKIVRKHQGLLIPLLGKIEKNDSLVALVRNFSSKNLQYYWDFNDVFLSQDREIPASLLNRPYGVLRLRVFGFSPRENAVDVQTIYLE